MRNCRFGIMLLAAALCSCTSLKVETVPGDATVMWSPDGVETYRQWPPDSWEWPFADKGSTTPFSTRGWFGETYFITVEKEGYRRPLPQVVQLHGLRNEKLAFDLVELPETTAARMRAEGLLLYNGKWVNPEEAGVVEYNGVVMKKDLAYRLEQKERGLVEYGGEWLAPEEAKRREAEEKIAAGFVNYKDRWVTPEVKEKEASIDAEVAAIAAEKSYPDLPAPKAVGNVSISDAQIQIYNSTPQQARFLFSGPLSREYIVNPFQSYGVRAEERILLTAGRYDIVVIPTGRDASGRDLKELAELLQDRSGVKLEVESLWGSWPLPAGRILSFNYTGKDKDLQETLDSFEPPNTDFDFEAPTIEIPELDLPPEEGRRRPPGSSGGGRPGGGRRR